MRSPTGVIIRFTTCHHLYQRFYIEFPGCITKKNVMLFSKLGYLEQVLCCSKLTRNVYTNLKNRKIIEIDQNQS